MQEARQFIVLQNRQTRYLNFDIRRFLTRKRYEVMVVMVISGEASAGLNPKHSAGDSEAFGDVANPRNEGIIDEAGNGAA